MPDLNKQNLHIVHNLASRHILNKKLEVDETLTNVVGKPFSCITRAT